MAANDNTFATPGNGTGRWQGGVRERATSLPENRVRGFSRCRPGRLCARHISNHGMATSSRACGYNYASGRAKWLSRDPIGEDGGLNLYGYVGNSPIDDVDPYGLWIGTRLFKIYKLWRESGTIKRELVHEISNKNLRDSLKEMKDTLDSIDPNRYKRVVEAENGVSAEGIAEKLSKNKQCRGPEGKPPYNRHYNPETGPYKDVHVEPGFSRLAAMALIPHAYEASNTEGITTGEFSATAAWDVLNGVDPVGVTDLMEWLFTK